VTAPTRTLVFALAAVVLSLPACAGGGPGSGTITIGVDLPLTGAEGRAGTSTINGVSYFVSRHPILQGFNVVLDARDDAGVAADGARNVAEFVSHPGLLAMIGPFDSEVARAAIPVANQAHLAMVSPATSSRCLTKEPFLPAGLNPLRTAITCRAAGLPSPADLRP
jgi:ABC-type branched-subunit amino acid transport system substrate-binding protein